MKLFSSVIDGLRRNMDLRLLRQGLINANITNADTPGYRPVDLTFKEELSQALNAGEDEMSVTKAGHMGMVRQMEEVEGEVVEEVGELSPDGNAVDIDRQMAELSSNATNYIASARMVNKQLALMKYVINQTR